MDRMFLRVTIIKSEPIFRLAIGYISLIFWHQYQIGNMCKNLADTDIPLYILSKSMSMVVVLHLYVQSCYISHLYN